MNVKNIELSLPEGKFNAEVIEFDKNDRVKLANIYKEWRTLCDLLREIGGRNVNLPEGLSESAFCLEMNMYRVDSNVSGANTSFDAYNTNGCKRVQVKACSVLPDLTSFGPKSIWDELYFCDFYRNGDWNGTFDIYLIDNDLIYNHKVNKTQTMRDQQKEKRRPRFSIYKELITKNNIQPVKTGSLF
jgi:hypothetical protein